MEVKYNITLLPKKTDGLVALLDKVNSKFEDTFEINGKFISTKSPLENLDKENISDIEGFGKECKFHVFSSWISDDIAMSGMALYDFEKNDSMSFESNLGATSMGMFSFLVFCGMEEYFSGILF